MPTFVALILMCAAFACGSARAFIIAINPGTKEVYLSIGNGSYTGTYTTGGPALANATINKVSVSVPANSIGTGAPQAMTSNSTQATSFYDGRVFCTLPNQVYIGGYIRKGFGAANGTLTVTTSAANLTNVAGDTIPFTEISWTSSGIGDAGAQPFPAGTFTGGTQTVGDFPVVSWRESCHTFSYANSVPVAFGVFTGRATYTLSAP